MSAPHAVVRLAVVGCGVIGREHLQAAAALDGVEVVAVADLSHDVVQRAAADFAIDRMYTDPLEVLTDSRVEAVILALPTAPRQALALAALGAGKHVLLEKPAAATVEDLRTLIAARGQLVAACCSARFRTTDLARTATEII